MLTGLRDIDWASLEHAYGDARDTPRHLERLLSRSARVRRDALRALSHSVYHQSGGYSASPHALRVLVELLAAPDVHQKAGLLRLACDLGIVAGARPFIATGYTDPVAWLERWYGRDETTSLEAFLECRRIFEAATDLFLRLLEDEPASLRLQSAYALAWVPGRRAAIQPRLQARFGLERNAKVRASILLALGLLSVSMVDPERGRLRAWLSALEPQPHGTVVGAAQAIAALYLRDEMPEGPLDEALGEVILSELNLGPFPWFGGNLSELVTDVYSERARDLGWPVAARFASMLQRAVVDRRTSDRLAPRLASALLKTVFDDTRAADAPLSAAQRSALEAVIGAAGVFRRPEGVVVEDVLRAGGLPSDVPSLARLLGWLPEKEPEPTTLVDLLPPRVVRSLPRPLLESTGIDPTRMLSRFHPFDRALLARVADLVDWELVSQNRALIVDDALLSSFGGRWSVWHLGMNPAVAWTADRIERFADQLSWRALSTRKDIAWSEPLLEQHEDRWDWDMLSSNTALPWSEALLDRHRDRWAWSRLSHNPALPWSESLLRRYRRWDWEALSGNDGLPWSEAFFRRHLRKWDWCELCKASRFPWTESFLEEHRERLACWGHLSENPGLPWSAELIQRYAERWNWEMLSRNTGLPWSRELVLRFEDQWTWRQLVFNRALPWGDPDVLERFARHAGTVHSWWFRNQDHCLPWSDAQIGDHRLHHLLSADDRTLYSRFFAPVMGDELVLSTLQRAAVVRAEAALEQAVALHGHVPALASNHQLLEALGIVSALQPLLDDSADGLPMLREAAARALVRAPWLRG